MCHALESVVTDALRTRSADALSSPVETWIWSLDMVVSIPTVREVRANRRRTLPDAVRVAGRRCSLKPVGIETSLG